MSIPDRIQLALKTRGHSQQGFGTKQKISRGGVNRLVTGSRGKRPAPETLARFADGLQIWYQWLALGRDAMDPSLGVAIAFARLDGVPDDVVERFADEAGREALHTLTPSQWLAKIRAAAKAADMAAQTPAPPPKRVKLQELILPKEQLTTFAERLRFMRTLHKWSIDQLSERTGRVATSRVAKSTIDLFESGNTVAQESVEEAIVERLRKALMVDPVWFGRPSTDVKHEHEKPRARRAGSK